MKKTYKIEVDCANCANLMEDAARKTAGVQSCYRELYDAEDDRGICTRARTPASVMQRCGQSLQAGGAGL